MGRLKRYATALRRIKRSKGFGIHSPFAFGFARSVLAMRLSYYAYADIARWRAEAHAAAHAAGDHQRVISLKNAKLIFRVVCRFNPMAMIQIGCTYGVSTRAALAVDSRSTIVVYPGANPHINIYNKVVEPVDSRIIRVKTLTEGIDALSALDHGGHPRLALLNHLSAADYAPALSLIERLLADGGVLIARNLAHSPVVARLWTSVTSSMNAGMSFTNGKIGIIAGMRHLPRQNFSLWF